MTHHDCTKCYHAPCICELNAEMAQLENDKAELEAQVAEKDRVIELLHEQWPYRVEWAQAKAKETHDE